MVRDEVIGCWPELEWVFDHDLRDPSAGRLTGGLELLVRRARA